MRTPSECNGSGKDRTFPLPRVIRHAPVHLRADSDLRQRCAALCFHSASILCSTASSQDSALASESSSALALAHRRPEQNSLATSLRPLVLHTVGNFATSAEISTYYETGHALTVASRSTFPRPAVPTARARTARSTPSTRSPVSSPEIAHSLRAY
jgi:hypothetical protein